MQGIRAATLPVARRGLTLLALSGGAASTSLSSMTSKTWCQKKTEVFTKDDTGNINWSKTIARIPEPAFWDDVAKAAGENLQGAIDSGIPTQLSYGFVMGYCAGMALKKVGKVAATVAGLGFVSLQTLSYYGYVKVDHVAIKRDFDDFLDLNKDGTIDQEDGKIATTKILQVLQFNLPAGGGFATGFIGGLRSG